MIVFMHMISMDVVEFTMQECYSTVSFDTMKRKRKEVDRETKRERDIE